jgi:heme oxygenase (biliverdin-IX-beta and delta-forming)
VNRAHAALRAGTQAAHDAVDAAFAAFDLGDRHGYAAFLSAHAELVWPLEAALPGERIVADWPDRRRGALLREDLAFLPRLHAPPSGDHDALIAALSQNDPATAGALYVLEGSRLGGRFLARRLPKGSPRAYLDAEQRPGNWQRLLDVIDGLLVEPAALDAALAAARATFRAFELSAGKWQGTAIGDR